LSTIRLQVPFDFDPFAKIENYKKKELIQKELNKAKSLLILASSFPKLLDIKK
jgi:hypothetical protein